MKRRILDFCLFFTMILSLQSCFDLDVESDGRLQYQDIFSEWKRTANYFNSTKNYIPQIAFNYDASPLASFSDEAHDASDGVNGIVYDWYHNRVSAANFPLYGPHTWSRYFEGIRKCSSFIENFNNPDICTYPWSENQRNGMNGEIRVLRAYYYLQLIKRFGGVPIIETPYEIDHDYSKDKRASFEECVDFILQECDYALNLPESDDPNVGFRWQVNNDERMTLTRAFAYAVKSQAALYAASPLWYTPDSKYNWKYVTEITKEALDQCLAHDYKLFDLEPNPDVAQNCYDYYFIHRFEPGRAVDKETIFESTSSRADVWKWAGTPIIVGAEKAGACPSQELVDAYGMKQTGEMPILGYSDADHLEPIINEKSGYDPLHPYEGRDPRFYASIYFNNSPRLLADPNTPLVETYVGGNCEISEEITEKKYTRTGYYMRKFNHNKSNANFNGEGYIKMFRLGELYMNFAEAAYQAYGPDVQVASKINGIGSLSARDAVNLIRARVDMPDIPTGLTTEEFEIRYRNERQVEFAFEEHRFYDVRRWKILENTDKFVTGMRIIKNEDNSFTYNRIKLQDRNTNTNKYLIFPLSLSEVSKIQSLTGQNWQNPGW